MKPLGRGPRIILFALAVAAVATLALIVPVQEVVETLQAWRSQQPVTAFFAMVGAAARTASRRSSSNGGVALGSAGSPRPNLSYGFEILIKYLYYRSLNISFC